MKYRVSFRFEETTNIPSNVIQSRQYTTVVDAESGEEAFNKAKQEANFKKTQEDGTSTVHYREIEILNIRKIRG